MERQIRAVVGTAGHVDHGKTTLVHHLTGIDTDRLEQEKSRGISIELGFAWLNLPEGRAAIVDVPGHERFVRHMIAGAAGVDLVLLVVAADEGVMPQTREHLDICEMLGVRLGGVVITKTDLVDDPEWLDLVEEDLRDELRGTFLEGAPLTRWQPDDDEATERVRAMLADLVARGEGQHRLASRSPDRPFKMSVDRSFTVRGFGTVVTGTSASGRLAAGDEVALLPPDLRGRVRGLQVHGETVDEVGPGMRAAINLQGVEHEGVSRGDVLTHPDALEVTSMIDGEFKALGRLEEPLPDRTRALVHVGTARIEGTLAWIGVDEVAPGQRVPVQVRLDAPVALLPGEPFVVRGFTVLAGYGRTLGGGRALIPAPRRHRRRWAEAETRLVDALSGTDPEAMLAELLRFEGPGGVATARLAALLPLERAAIDAAARALVERGVAVEAGELLLHEQAVDALAPRVEDVLSAHHRERPAWPGIGVEELRTRLRKGLSPEIVARLLERMEAAGRIRRDGDLLALPDFEPRRSDAQRARCATVYGVLEEGGLTPPRRQDLPEAAELADREVDETLELLRMDRRVVRVNRELFYARPALDDLRERLVAHLEEHGTIDTGTFKELTQASRKWTIPLQEYFDRERVTLRVGDLRRLRR
ncbi:MAG: selenocysteine-specific translation elongation factor [Myxococcota bacterium]